MGGVAGMQLAVASSSWSLMSTRPPATRQVGGNTASAVMLTQ